MKFRNIVFIVLFFFVTLLGSCKTVQTAQISNSHDTVYITSVEQVYDSIYIDRFHYEIEKGDTVFIKDSVYGWKWKYLTQIDTCYISRSVSDTIVKTETQIVKERSSYDKFVSWGFWILFVIILSLVAVKIIGYFRK